MEISSGAEGPRAILGLTMLAEEILTVRSDSIVSSVQASMLTLALVGSAPEGTR